MRWLLLIVSTLQIVHSSCPDGFELVRDGECRGFYTEMLNYDPNYPQIAFDKCAEVQGQPVIIHSEEEQQYWANIAATIRPPSYLVLGLNCNCTNHRFEWVDGSIVDYKPPGYFQGLDWECFGDYTTIMGPRGYWDQTVNAMDDVKISTAEVFCTTQLHQPPGEGCDGFEDESEDGMCYQVGLAAGNWGEAQATCRNLGADMASIHNLNENSFIRRLAVSNGAVNGLFLGATLSGKGKEFGWVDGSKWDYDNFYPGFPIDGLGECLTMDTLSTAGQWVNVDCASNFPVACARPRNVPTCTSGPFTEGQTIYSPGYPFDASEPCNYVLTVDSGMLVQIQVKSLEANTCCDHLILTDNYIGGNTIANLTGEITDKIFTSDKNVMRVTWQPNGGVNVRGMMITFYAVNVTETM